MNLSLVNKELNEAVENHHRRREWRWLIENEKDLYYPLRKRFLNSSASQEQAHAIYSGDEEAEGRLDWIDSISLIFCPQGLLLALDTVTFILQSLCRVGLQNKIREVVVDGEGLADYRTMIASSEESQKSSSPTENVDAVNKSNSEDEYNSEEEDNTDELDVYKSWDPTIDSDDIKKWFTYRALHWDFWSASAECTSLDLIELRHVALRCWGETPFSLMNVKKVVVSELIRTDQCPLKLVKALDADDLLREMAVVPTLNHFELVGVTDLPNNLFSSCFSGGWDNLKRLAIRDCAFRGAPDVDLSMLNISKTLEVFDLSGSPITSISGLSSAANLKSLGLKRCNLSRIAMKQVSLAVEEMKKSDFYLDM
jgi:hypothetical protein